MQVFQTANAKRGNRFKWFLRFTFLLVALSIAFIVLALYKEYTPGIPRLMQHNSSRGTVPINTAITRWKKGKQSPGFRDYILNKKRNLSQLQNVARYNATDSAMAAPMRAAFYVAWDAQSYFSLRSNVSKMNTILPEWFFVDTAGNLTSNIDRRGFDIIKASGIKVLPMLSNNFQEKFRPEGLHRILNDKAFQQVFIQRLLRVIQGNHFDGINIDFEELQEKGDESLISFQKNLYQVFHSHGLLVTQDVSPFNEDYNYNELQRYNDYLFLMAYDEHSSDSDPGAISSQRWVESAVDMVAKNVASNKIILCMAAYGYDWAKGQEGTDVTFQEALSTARAEGVKPVFDNDTYNLHYNYDDDDGIVHEVDFTDAASNFNVLRFAASYGLGGTAIWRLGSEDSRVWTFYRKDLDDSVVRAIDLTTMTNVPGTNDVDYIGEGEVLDVLTNPSAGKIIPRIDSAEWLISEENYAVLPSMFVVKKWGKPLTKKMVLTFDDGPDPVYTRQILDTLAKYHVPASFFVVGIQAEENIPLVKEDLCRGS